jgi:ABC-type nitrate/sulfonate/bicarbonate transport system ATPase subunit
VSVSVSGLEHRFPTADGPLLVLDDVAVAVGDGELVALVGPSGCGKSTLLRILAGLEVPSGGQVLVDRVAYMPQRDALLPWRRAVDNAVLGAQVGGEPVASARRRALELFPSFGLAGFERAWPGELSGGMRQRLALLRTFLMPASTLLLDEPLGALDAITRRQLQGWVEERWRDEQPRRSVLLVTHDVEEALLLADRVLVMSPRPGRVVASVDSGFSRPRDGALVLDPAFVAAKAELLEALAEDPRN